MFYRWRVVLLALGAVLGYGFGIRSMRHSADGFGARHRHEAFERHVAELCVDAADRGKNDKAPPKAEPRPSEPATP